MPDIYFYINETKYEIEFAECDLKNSPLRLFVSGFELVSNEPRWMMWARRIEWLKSKPNWTREDMNTSTYQK